MQAGTLDFDIAIVGLGPVGAVAANLAGAAGFRTLVLERGDQPYLKPRAIVFDAEIMRIFDSIGLADSIAKASRPLEGSIYLGADRKPIRTFRARARAHELAWHPSNLFYQPQLERILREGLTRFPNVTVMREHDVRDVRQADARSVLSVAPAFSSAPSFEACARYVLACDGASSTVRKAQGIPLDDIGFEERWLVLDALVSGPMRWPQTHAVPEEVRSGRYSLMVCDPARPSTLIPGVGRHRRWEYMLMPGERDEDVVGEAWLREQLAQWIDPADVEIVRAAVYRFRALIAQSWHARNVFLVGDAAHQTPPFYGQGMCHGIRDAAQLIWKLRLATDGVASVATLDSYQAEREPHVREIIAASVAAGAQVCKLDPDAAAARDAEFRRIEAQRSDAPAAITDVVPPIRAGIIDPVSGGMRLPELACVTPDGSLRRVDELLAGRFAILSLRGALSPDNAQSLAEGPQDFPEAIAARWRELNGHEITLAPADASGAHLRDHNGNFALWLSGQRARWVIIRPDRYIYSTAADPRALCAQLERLFAQIGCPDRSTMDERSRDDSPTPIQQVSLS
jgi:3-(3-hydroxy-phenyl)propionate hydroxylase